MLRCVRAPLLMSLATLWVCSTWACSGESGTRDGAVVAARDATTASADAAPIVADDATTVDASPDPIDATAADAGPDPVDATAPDADPTFPDAAPALPDAEPAAPDAAEPADGGPAPMLTITSPSVTAGGVIPDLHACGGRDIQPQLDFANIPAGTQSLAVVLIDDSIDFVHWIALDIPAATTQLPQAASDDRMLPAPTREIPAYGTQYRGPCPGNTHTYTFRLYALSVAQTTFTWPRTIRGSHLAAAFGANTLAEARLTATYTP